MAASFVGWNRRQEAEGVVRRLRERGFEALFAGGCVRDHLLEREAEDYDVATSASAAVVQDLFPRTVAVGAKFGVIKVLAECSEVEVATFRSDGAYLDHRHPVSVRFSDAHGDASRRDFTINGMFLDPISGELIDYVGGRADLESRVLRAIGDPDARFGEDRLRLLRAVRFAARFGFEIEDATWRSLRYHAPTITQIAWERIGDEIVKVLREGAARRGFALLADSGLLEMILPEIAAMRGVEQSPEHHPEGDVFVHTLLCLDKLEAAKHDVAFCLGVLLHDVAKPPCARRGEDGRIRFHGHCELGASMSTEICQRLRRSRAIGDQVAWLVGNHLRHLQMPEMRPAKVKRFLAEPWIDSLLELVYIDVASGSGDFSLWQYFADRRAALSERDVQIEALLSGRDLVELGYVPGPSFKPMLEGAFDAQLEGEFETVEAGRQWIRDHFPTPEAGSADE